MQVYLVFVFVCRWVYAHVLALKARDLCYMSSSIALYQNQELKDSARLSGQQAPGLLLSRPPRSGFRVQARFLCGWLGVWTQVLSLAQQALDRLNHFPSPLIFFLYSFISHIIESFHDHTPTSNLKGYIIINLLRKSNSLLKIKRNYRVTQSSTPVLRLLWIDLCFAT